MKGLIRNNFYSMESNIKTAFLMSALLIFTPFVINHPRILSVIVSVQIFIFIANIGTSLHADEVAKWNIFELTLPVDPGMVIMAKYVSFSLLIVFGLIISAFTGIVSSLLSASADLSSIIAGYEYGLTLSLIVAAIMYPVMLKIGTEKNELIILFSAFISVILMLFIAFIVSLFSGEMAWQAALVRTISLVVSLLLFLLSYFVSLKIYKKKEF